PSGRGELEIIELLDLYRAARQLKATQLDANTKWLDTGTQRDLLAAGQYVERVQRQSGRPVGSPEWAAWQTGRLDRSKLIRLGIEQQKCDYGQLLLTASKAPAQKTVPAVRAVQ
ncbi:MAG: hypothetical protein AAF386_11885, partial [Pseudomonadota bacterium]